MKSRQILSNSTAISALLVFGVTIATASIAQAQDVASTEPSIIITDPNKTSLDITTSAIPIVNIAKPDDKGTSHNIYYKFNIGKEGLIFNNASQAGNSILGGYLFANPNLVNGASANLILNEVVGSSRSDILGAVEVFGKAAPLIIANPFGITCDGCGFLNTPHVTLSTGKLLFDADNNFTGFRVEGGDIQISGQGLFGANPDYFDIISGYTKIDANIYAKDLVVAAGNYEYDYKEAKAKAIDSNSGAKFAIDSSLLGGMYANRIRLIGSGSGVGVNLQGIATTLTDNITIDTSGAVNLSDVVSADRIDISSSGGNIDLNGQLYSKKSINLSSAFDINQNSDFVGALENINLNAKNNININGLGVFAGLDAEGNLTGQGALSLNSSKYLSLGRNGKLISTLDLSINAENSVFEIDSAISAKNLNINIANEIIHKGYIETLEDAIFAANKLKFEGAIYTGNNLQLSGADFDINADIVGYNNLILDAKNRINLEAQGALRSAGLTTIKSADLSNKGAILSQNGIAINSNNFNNLGQILSGGQLKIDTQAYIDNLGTIYSENELFLFANGLIKNSGKIISNSNLFANSSDFSLDGIISANGNINLKNTNFNSSSNSQIVSNNNIEINSNGELKHNGLISSVGDTALLANKININGDIQSAGYVDIAATDAAINGNIIADKSVTLISQNDANIGGTLSSAEYIGIAANNINISNGAKVVAKNDIDLLSASDISNQGIISGTNIAAEAANLTNSGAIYADNNINFSIANNALLGGIIYALGASKIDGENVDVTGKLISNSDIEIYSKNINLSDATEIQTGAQLTLFADDIINSKGNILVVSNANFLAGNKINSSANIVSGGGVSLFSNNQLNLAGNVSSNGDISLNSNYIDASSNFSTNSKFIVNAQNYARFKGDINAIGLVNISAPNLYIDGLIATNSKALINSSDVAINGDLFSASGVEFNGLSNLSLSKNSSLQSGAGLVLSLNKLDNKGYIGASDDLKITNFNTFTNDGTIYSDKDIIISSLNSAGVFNVSGAIASIGKLNIDTDFEQNYGVNSYLYSQLGLGLKSQNNVNFAGYAYSKNDIAIDAIKNLNINGAIESLKNINLNSNNFDNLGTISAVSNIKINSNDFLLSVTGKLLSNGFLEISNIGKGQFDGIIQSDSDVKIASYSIDVKGQISSLGSLSLDAKNNLNIIDGANLLSGKDVKTSSNELSNNGIIASTGNINLVANNNATIGTKGQISANGIINISAKKDILNQGIINSDGAQTINATGNINNENIIASNGSIDVNSIDLINKGVIATSGNLKLLSTGKFENYGKVSAGEELVSKSSSLLNKGSIISDGNMDINVAKKITNQSEILSNKNLSLNFGEIDNAGIINSYGDLSLLTLNNLNLNGEISTAGALKISANDLNIDAILTGGKSIDINGNILNIAKNAIITSGGILSLTSRQNLNNSGTTLSVGDSIFKSSNNINMDGNFSSYGKIDIDAVNDIIANASILADANIVLSAKNINLSGSAGSNSDVIVKSSGDIILDSKINNYGNLIFEAANNLTVKNQIVTAGDVNLIAKQAIINGELTNAKNFTTNTESVDLKGNIITDGAANINAGESLKISGSLSSIGNQSLISKIITIDGSSNTNQSLNIIANSSIINGALFANKDINITSSGAFAGVGKILSNGIIKIDANDIGYSGDITTLKSLELNSVQNTILGGNVNVGTSLNAKSGGNFENNAKIYTGVDINIDATGNIINTGELVGYENVNLKSAALNSSNYIAANKNIDIIALSGDVFVGKISSGKDININSNGNLTLNNDLISGENVSLKSLKDINVKKYLYSVGMTKIATDGNINVDGSGNIIGKSSLDINSNNFYNSGLVNSDGLLKIRTTNSINNLGQISGLNDVSLNIGGNFENANSGIISSGNNLSIFAQNANIGGEISSLGSANLSLKNSYLTGIIQSKKELNLLIDGTLNINNNAIIASDALIAIDAAKDTELNGKIYAGTGLSIISAANLDINNIIQSGANLKLKAVNLNSNNNIISAADTQIDALNNINLSGALFSNGKIDINASIANLLANSEINSNNKINLNASEISSSGKIYSKNNIEFTALNKILSAGVISSETSINLNATNNITHSGSLFANEKINLNAAKIDFNGNAISYGDLSIIVGDISFGVQSDAKAANLLNILASNLVDAKGKIYSGNELSIKSNDTIKISGEVNSNKSIDASAQKLFDNSGKLAAGDNIIISAEQIASNGTLLANKDINISNKGIAKNIDISGIISAIGKVEILSGGDVNLNGIIETASDANIVSGNNIDLGNLNSIYAQNNLILNASNNFANNGTIISKNLLAINAKNIANSGVIQTAKDLNISANSLDIAGTLLSLGDINLSASVYNANLNAIIGAKNLSVNSINGDVILGANLQAQVTGNANFIAKNNLIAGGKLSADGNLILTSTNGNISLDNNADYVAIGTLSANALNNFTSSGKLSAANQIDINAKNITSGSLLSNENINLNSINNVVINANVTSAKNINIANSALGDININNNSALYSSGDVALNSLGQISNSGYISAKNNIYINSTNAFNNNGEVNTQTGNIELNSSALNLNNYIYSAANLKLNSRILNIGGVVASKNLINFTGDKITLNSLGNLHSEDLINLNVNSIENDGRIEGVTGVDLALKSLLKNSNGQIISGVNLNINSDDISNNGTLYSQNDINLSGNNLVNSGKIYSLAKSKIDFSKINNDGVVASGSDLLINTSDAVFGTNSIVNSDGKIGINTLNLTNSGIIFGNEDTNIIASTSLLSNKNIATNGNLNLSSNGLIDISGNVSAAKFINIIGKEITQSGSVNSLNNVPNNSKINLVTIDGNLNINGELLSSGNINYNANGDANFGSGAIVNANNGIEGNSKKINNQGSIGSLGNIKISTSDDFISNGQIISNSNLDIISSGEFILNNNGQIGANYINITASDIVDKGIISSANDLNLATGSNFTIDGELYANGDINFNNRANETNKYDLNIGSLAKIVSYSNINANNINNLLVSGVFAASKNISAKYSGIANVNGYIGAGSDISLESLGGYETNISGEIIARNNLNITGGILNVSGLIHADNDLNFTTNSYAANLTNINIGSNGFDLTNKSNSILISGILEAGNNINLNGPGNLILFDNGEINANGDANFNAGNFILGGKISSGKNIYINNLVNTNGAILSNRGIFVANKIQAIGDVTMNGIDFVNTTSNAKVLSNNTINISGAKLNLDGLLSAANLISLNANGIYDGVNFSDSASIGDIYINGKIYSGDKIKFNASNNIAITNTGVVQTIGNSRLINLARNQGDGANIYLNANNAVNNKGAIYSDGSIFLNSNNGNIDLSGIGISGANSVILQALNGSINHTSGTLSGGGLGFIQSNDYVNSNGYSVAGNLLIDAPNITNNALLGAGGTLLLNTSGNVYNNNVIFAGGDISIDAKGNITNDVGTILANNSIFIKGNDFNNLSAEVQSISGDIVINAQNINNKIKTLIIESNTSTGSGTGTSGGTGGSGSTGGTGGGSQNQQQQNIFASPQAFSFASAMYANDTSSVDGAGGGFGTDTGTTDSGGTGTGGTDTGTGIGGTDTGTGTGGTDTGTGTGGTDTGTGTGGTGTGTGTTDPNIYIEYVKHYADILEGYNNSGGQYGDMASYGAIHWQTHGQAEGRLLPSAHIFNTSSIKTNSGSSKIIAARDINIETNGGNVLNSNSSILAGRNIVINTGILNNNADVLTTSEVDGYGVSTSTIYELPNSPTIIQAGGTLLINAATINNTNFAHRIDNSTFVPPTNTIPSTDGGNIGAQGSGENSGGAVLKRSYLSKSNRNLNNNAAAQPINSGTSNVISKANLSTINNKNGANIGNVGNGAGNNSAINNVSVTNKNTTKLTGSVSNPKLSNNDKFDISITQGPSKYMVNDNLQGPDIDDGIYLANPSQISKFSLKAYKPISGDANAIDPNEYVNNNDSLNPIGHVIDDNYKYSGDINNNKNVIVGDTRVSVKEIDAPINYTLANLTNAFGNIALPNISGGKGNYGDLISSFLGQFNLINSQGGFDFASGQKLYDYNQSPNSKYLFTTNPSMQSTAQLYNSDIFFDVLNTSKVDSYTRLGDGFFESMLISKQIQEATNQSQLPKFGTALDQYNGLLKSASEQSSSLGLTLGVALSASQVANLTSSIVWWVSEKIEGKDVLVPVVYLAEVDKNSTKAGANLSGTNVVLNTKGDINNQANIGAKGVTIVKSGGDIINGKDGSIVGANVSLDAKNNVLLAGASKIAGNDVSIKAGNNVNMDTITNSFQKKDISKGQTTISNGTNVNGANINAANNLIIVAGNEINAKAANIGAGNDATLAAKNINIGGAQTTLNQSSVWDKGNFVKGTSSSSSTGFTGSNIVAGNNLNVIADDKVSITGSKLATASGNITISGANGVDIKSGIETSNSTIAEQLAKRSEHNGTSSSTTNVLSNIKSGANLNVVSAKDINIAGANLDAKANTALAATNVNINGVIDEVNSNDTTWNKKKKTFSSKTTTTGADIKDQTIVQSTISGDKVSINALNDINVKSAAIASTNDLALKANNNINVGTLVENDSSLTSSQTKKSGISLSLSSIFVGTQKTSTTTDAKATTNNQSLIGSEKGNVEVSAGGDINVKGSQIVGTKDVNFAANNINIENATDTYSSKTISKSSSSGLTISSNNQALQGIQNTVQAAKIASSSSNERVKAIAGAAAVVSAVNTYDAVKNGALKTPTSIKEGIQAAGLSVSIGSNKSESTTTTNGETNVASTIAGNNVSIRATGGNVNVIGSGINADKDLSIAATGDVNLQSSTQTNTMSSTSKSSGASIGYDFAQNAVTFGVNGSKGNAQGKDVSHSETTLNAGNNVTINAGNALNMTGAIINGDKVKIDAASLKIESQQDVSTYKSENKSLSAGLKIGAGTIGGNVNASAEKQKGDFASVQEQSGIFAGSGGYEINVKDKTSLVGGVISSSADASNNNLSTGTLVASNIENREKYSATSTSVGFSTDGKKISAGLPSAMNAGGDQSSTTNSAIANGTINITSGDKASQDAANNISHDTANAANALTKQYTEEMRNEIANGFTATNMLATGVGTFLQNRETEKEKIKEKIESGIDEKGNKLSDE
ncbi:MAG: hemagglutinin repeat-containing protein [Caulobacterales bacterium]|nr:hemagglutinin repeat-containing protein [Caulobacterales bacterium]